MLHTPKIPSWQTLHISRRGITSSLLTKSSEKNRSYPPGINVEIICLLHITVRQLEQRGPRRRSTTGLDTARSGLTAPARAAGGTPGTSQQHVLSPCTASLPRLRVHSCGNPGSSLSDWIPRKEQVPKKKKKNPSVQVMVKRRFVHALFILRARFALFSTLLSGFSFTHTLVVTPACLRNPRQWSWEFFIAGKTATKKIK